MSSAMAGPDVLVVGAGPTGLALACELARHGVSFRIVDQLEAPAGIPKAVGVQPRTLEAFDIMGLVDEFLAHGHKIYGINVYAGGQRLAHVSLDGMPTRYSHMLTIPQSETERLLGQRLSSLGGHVERPVRLTGLKQQEDGVVVTLQAAGGTAETVHARWLVGCDGAHSAVRHALDLPFEGSRYEEGFLLAYVRIETDLPTDEAHAFFTPEGPMAVLPLPQGRHYLILPLLKPASEDDQTSVSFEEITALLAARGLSNVRLVEPFWVTKFRIHRRMVPKFRVGRTFLCGDAAHIHSPVGGQGMNLGIQDAFNLAWKLALVLRGTGRPILLDSYHPERHPIAEATLSATDLATKTITLRNPVAQALRNQIAVFLSSLDVVQHRLSESVAGIVWNYRRSPIVAEHRTDLVGALLRDDVRSENPGLGGWRDFGAAPSAGDRAPDGAVSRPGAETGARLYEALRTPRHTLLLFDGRAATAAGYRTLAEIGRVVQSRYGDLMAVHIVVPASVPPTALQWNGSVLLDADGELHHRYGAGSECLYLIRPDGYVGYRSQPADKDRLLGYFERILKP